MLEIRHGIHALYLFFRNRVLAVPLDKDLLLPGLELEVVIVLHSVFRSYLRIIDAPAVVMTQHIINLAVGPVAVARSHIEIRASKVTFVLILRFEHREIDIQRRVVYLTDLQRTGSLNVCLRHTERIIAAGTVRRGVRGVEVVTVFVRIVLVSAPPGLRKTMLDITSGSHIARVADVGPIVAIHVHHVSLVVAVGIEEHSPCGGSTGTVRDSGMVTDKGFEGVLEGTVFESVRRIIETRREAFSKHAERQQTKEN